MSALRACEIINREEVLKLAGATTFQVPPSELAPGETEGCNYVVLTTEGDSEYFHIAFQAANLTEALLSTISAEAKGEKIAFGGATMGSR